MFNDMLWLAVHHMFSFHWESSYYFKYFANKCQTYNTAYTSQFTHNTCKPFAFLSISTASIQSSCSTRPISLPKVASAPTETVKMHLKLDPTLVGVLLLLGCVKCKEHWFRE